MFFFFFHSEVDTSRWPKYHISPENAFCWNNSGSKNSPGQNPHIRGYYVLVPCQKNGSETIKKEELMDGQRQMGRKDEKKENKADKAWTGKKKQPEKRTRKKGYT